MIPTSLVDYLESKSDWDPQSFNYRSIYNVSWCQIGQEEEKDLSNELNKEL